MSSPVIPAVADSIQAIVERLDLLVERSHAAPQARYLSIKSAAGYTELSEDSIRRMLERGDLTALRPVRGKILIDRQELDAVILGSTTRPRMGRGIHRRASA
jgi:excisionase family DNA binding protein